MEKSTNNKKTIIFYALTSLILICIIGVLVFIANKHLSSIKNDVPINNSSTNQSNDLITADVDVKIKTKTFEFSCNKLEISNDKENDDYRLVSFHIKLKNLSNQKLIIQDYMVEVGKVDSASGLLQGDVTVGNIEYAIKSANASIPGLAQFTKFAKEILMDDFNIKKLEEKKETLRKKGRLRNHLKTMTNEAASQLLQEVHDRVLSGNYSY